MNDSKNKLQQLAAQGRKQTIRTIERGQFKAAVKASSLIPIGKKIFPRILLLYPLVLIGKLLFSVFLGSYETTDPYVQKIFPIVSYMVAFSLLLWPLGWLESIWLYWRGQTQIHKAELRLIERKNRSEDRSVKRRAIWNSSWIAYLIRPTVIRLTILILYILCWLGVTSETINYYKYFREDKKPFRYYYYYKGKGTRGGGEFRTFDPTKDGYLLLAISLGMAVPLSLIVLLVPIARIHGWRNYRNESVQLASLGILASGYPEVLGIEPRHLEIKLRIYYKNGAPDPAIVKSAAQVLFNGITYSRASGSDLFQVPIYSDKFDIYITRMYKFYRLVHKLVESIHSEYPIQRIEVN